MKNPLQFPSPDRQQGASLIEVLVAIFIFSIGMLGIAALSSAAIRYQTGNVARSAVAASINDFADRMRSNIDAANGYTPAPTVPGVTPTASTGYVYTATYASQVGGTITFPTAPNCGAASCTPAELSAYDTAAWRLSLRNNLPGGAGLVSGDVLTGFDITVMWYDKEFVASDDEAFTDTPEPSRVCTAADSATSGAARFCCPAAASAPAGVRCYTTKVFP
jgi:type IV pilus assembly protein PilV